MSNHPLAEVFGFPITNMGPEAVRYRQNRLCPFGNASPNCTKDKKDNPLGVCSMLLPNNQTAIICPIRFRQSGVIVEDAARFFFAPTSRWTSLPEVQLKDRRGKSAGNIDFVLVEYNARGRIINFGALEAQAVYISGNIRNPFEKYMKDATQGRTFNWRGQPKYPRPDYVSSSRKRLVPQIISKGRILKTWSKKTAIALNRGFFETLPPLDEVAAQEADLAWFVYDLVHRPADDRFELTRYRTLYTKFEQSLETIARPEAGDVSSFIARLQKKVDRKVSTNEIAL